MLSHLSHEMASIFQKKWTNKQRVLVFGSRGIGYRERHLMENLRTLMPHSRKEVKKQKRDDMRIINEVNFLYIQTYTLYLLIIKSLSVISALVAYSNRTINVLPWFYFSRLLRWRIVISVFTLKWKRKKIFTCGSHTFLMDRPSSSWSWTVSTQFLFSFLILL